MQRFIAVHSDTIEDCMTILDEILHRCYVNNLRVNLKKLRIGAEQIICFGYIVSKDGLTADPKRVESLKTMNLPNKNKKTLKSAIASVNYYRNLIPNFSHLAKELYDLTGDKAKFVWIEKHTNLWNGIISELCKSILLYNIDNN